MRLRHVGRRWVLALAVVTLSIAALATTLAMADDRGSDSEKNKKQKVFDEEFSLRSGGELHIDVDDMDIHVKTGSGRKSSVQVFVSGRNREKAREFFDEMRFDARVEGNRLVIESHEPRFTGWISWNRNIHVWAVVSIPEKTDADIKTEDGDVYVDDLNGKACVRTEDGDLEFSEIRGPSIEIRTEDGDVSARFLEADEVTVATEDGDLQIDRIKGVRIRMSTSDGDIDTSRIEADDISVEVSDGDVEIGVSGRRLSVECSDGDMRVTILNEMELELRADDGDIELNIPKNVRADLDLQGGRVSVLGKIAVKGKMSKHSIRGSINDGGPLIRVKTSDGSILVRED